ncbi:TPA: hypothetical protein QC443_002563 [Bacillus cereus]|uniref:hypothetical protein n=1 Tax=Bacillus cereus group sp. BfR-BA-01700 TaxID=3094884 RepID=UPI002969094D|nr:hypothetical protein [Bacillus cereus group sp. BfR-BA-01700]MDX5840652.1 hypothetical protein [Bacillus cereus group sp. BfR-BA-01700]HDR7980286.1 hypothetical protein [Bacillus cereus]HDR8076514.1 hypothetical protein [Bacillus cereus]HDR8514863.1 hypothetical protein [Bacillus cereus]
MAKFSKPVAFNEKNEKDRLMLQHVKRRNFSGYVKKLIWEAMSLVEVEKEHTKQTEQPKAEKTEVKTEKTFTPAAPAKSKPTASERIQQLKSQTKKQQTPPSSLPFMPSNPQRY